MTISIRIISDDNCENDNCNSDNCKNRRSFYVRRLFKVQDDAAKLHRTPKIMNGFPHHNVERNKIYVRFFVYYSFLEFFFPKERQY